MEEEPVRERRETFAALASTGGDGGVGVGVERERSAEHTDCIYNVRQTLASRFHHRKPYPWIIKERSTRAGADVRVGGGVGGDPNTELNPKFGKRGGVESGGASATRAQARGSVPAPDLIRSGTYRRVSR